MQTTGPCALGKDCLKTYSKHSLMYKCKMCRIHMHPYPLVCSESTDENGGVVVCRSGNGHARKKAAVDAAKSNQTSLAFKPKNVFASVSDKSKLTFIVFQ